MAQKKSTGKASPKTQPKKSSGAKTAAAKKQEKEEALKEASVQQRVGSEALGVILIALGVLLGLYLYKAPQGFLGDILNKVLYGSLGLVALGLPPVFLVLGIGSIAGRKRIPVSGRGVVMVFLVVLSAALVHALSHISYLDENGKTIPIVTYILSSYDRAIGAVEGATRGGGVVGGVLCYLLQLLGGDVLCSVVIIAGIIVCLLILTRISLKTFPELVKVNFNHVLEKLDPDDEEEEPEEDEEEKAAPAIPASRGKKPLYTGTLKENDPEKTGHLENIPRADRSAAVKQKKEKPRKIPFDEAFTVPVAEAPRSEKEPDQDALSYFPTSGILTKKSAAPKNGFQEVEPIDDVLKLPNEVDTLPKTDKPPKAAVTPAANAEEKFPLPPRRSHIALPEEENKAVQEPGETVRPADPKNITYEELKTGFAPTPYKEGKAAPVEPERKPDEKFVYHDEATGEALPEPIAPPPVYTPPSLDCLSKPRVTFGKPTDSPQKTGELLLETLRSFNIETKLVNISVGPVVTRFELQPAPGIRVNRITTLSNDIALALAAPRVRIEAPIPGKAAVGVEVPNKNAATVLLRDIIDSSEFNAMTSPVTMAIGKDIGGKIVVADLSKMPHMLIAGSTGSGKSVCINDIILSMVYKSSPDALRLILVDPKQVELSVYSSLPHLLIPVVTDPKKAASALRWAVNEMTLRYKKFSDKGARDLQRYNELMEQDKDRLPRIVVIIDELADLMMVAPDEVEDCICRVAQLGRAAGIHLIVATQRPSTDVITGLIKANIPSRCSFAVSSAIDSRIILDCTGAEKLLGRGDCLFHPNGAAKPTRLQAAFVSDEEVENVMSHFKGSQEPQFDKQVLLDMSGATGGAKGGVFGEGKQEDELLGEAVRVVLDSGQASISMIQRKLRVGYARAARLVDMMEEQHFVSGFDGSKPRKVLITRQKYEELFGDSSLSAASNKNSQDDAPWEEDKDPS